jgi:hypothetical protein
MLERMHEHINSELHVNTRTDTIFALSAIVFNLVILGVNSAAAAALRSALSGGRAWTADGLVLPLAVFTILVVASLLVNGVALLGLQLGRSTRDRLLRGLLRMYEDSNVAQYYDVALLANYNRRYALFTVIVALFGLVAIAIPLATVWVR